MFQQHGSFETLEIQIKKKNPGPGKMPRVAVGILVFSWSQRKVGLSKGPSLFCHPIDDIQWYVHFLRTYNVLKK